MTPHTSASEGLRIALAGLDALLADPEGGRGPDAELGLLLLAAHPAATGAQWARVRRRLDDATAAFLHDGRSLLRAERGLRGLRGLLRHGPWRGRAWAACHARARGLARRADLLRDLGALLDLLEAEHPALSPD